MNRLLTVRLLMGWSLVMVVTFGVPAGAQGSPPPGPSGLEDAAASSCAAPATHGFNDVPTNHFANLAVGWLVGAGITSGTSPGTYSPSQPVTRAQMAVFLWRAAGGPTPVGPHGFNDVPAGHFAGTAVGWLVGAGITSGTSPGTYSPSQPVTRAQMAVFLWRAAGGPTPVGPHGFNDVPAGHFAGTAVGWLVGDRITSGTSPGRYSPSNMVTRAQMAVFLWRSSCPPPPVDFTMLTITDDGSYSMDESNGVVKVTNGQVGRGANTRVVVAKRGSPPDSVCATIESVTGAIVGFAQPGVAVHIRTAGGRTTALTLTNNVWATARWIWNAHHMDSGSSEGFTGLGSFEAPGFYREGQPLPPLPWRVCARTVGNTVQGKVWNAGAVEPAWGDPNFGGSVSIPRGLATGGESGVYAGHLQAGQGFRFSNVGPAAVAVRG
ncbi:S-layer homology domain-containing protein [Candidatus Microthrix sp.]|uniref:S-layer homology domain-containing protein n=1 Tax=Candidatus Neomicrothrix sp. TaxID=2719034 RepID=UPI002596CFEC|nr:S-layer homology domain-containing protein [Candidatus Microthrix sp.]HMS49452.1 S-layer homology domain-containing protein [Candidatus Microthrix sp.]